MNNEIFPTFTAEQLAAIFAGTIKAIIKDEVKSALDEINKKVDSLETYSCKMEVKVDYLEEQLNYHINDCDFGSDYDDKIERLESRVEELENVNLGFDSDDIDSIKSRLDDIEYYDLDDFDTDIKAAKSDSENALEAANTACEGLESLRDEFTSLVRKAIVEIASENPEKKEDENV